MSPHEQAFEREVDGHMPTVAEQVPGEDSVVASSEL